MQSGLNFISGVIKAEDDLRMKRMIFRISKGRALPSFFDMENGDSLLGKKDSKIKKKIFTIFFQGGIENVLLQKLIKVCDIFNASRFNIPRPNEVGQVIHGLNAEITEKNNFLFQAEQSIKNYLREKIGNVFCYFMKRKFNQENTIFTDFILKKKE